MKKKKKSHWPKSEGLLKLILSYTTVVITAVPCESDVFACDIRIWTVVLVSRTSAVCTTRTIAFVLGLKVCVSFFFFFFQTIFFLFSIRQSRFFVTINRPFWVGTKWQTERGHLQRASHRLRSFLGTCFETSNRAADFTVSPNINLPS